MEPSIEGRLLILMIDWDVICLSALIPVYDARILKPAVIIEVLMCCYDYHVPI